MMDVLVVLTLAGMLAIGWSVAKSGTGLSWREFLREAFCPWTWR